MNGDKLKPGWKTTEWWAVIIGKLLAVAVAGGMLSLADSQHLETQLGAVVAGVFAVLAIWRMVHDYINGRTELKREAMANGWTDETPTATASAGPRPDIPLAVAGLAMILLLLMPGTAIADPPAKHTALLPWRDRIERELRDRDRDRPRESDQLLQQLLANQQRLMELLAQRQPSPQVLYLTPPLQQIPLGGQPYQQIPLGGQPYQQIPLGGQPYQLIPLGQQPQQQIPLGGQPRQQIDPGTPGPPGQQLPIGPPPGQIRPVPQPGEIKPGPGQLPQTMPPAPTYGPPAAMQRFTPAIRR